MSQSFVFNHKKPSSLVKMTRVILGVFLLNTLLPPMVIAQIVADPNQSRRPIIHESANGTPQVNIQTPNHNGISMNHYAQFDVDGRGVILNNSRKDTQTQLGGYVQGNPWLATGEANLIVNQVNSANPSHLNGYIEIAGKRADLIIANPSGLNIDGAGFINANRAVLTTGDLLFEGGRLNGFSVQQGEINISGKGLDARDTNFTQILTSAANINAGIWGQDLKIVTGHFESDYEGNSIKGQAYQYSEDIPVYAIDTKNLGGMYAGQITLVSTDRDRHINIEGEVFANAGGVVINADGTISNSGVINSNQETANITINAKKVENSGTISSQHHQKISAKEIINSGLMAARGELSVKAKYLTVNQGVMNAGRIDITADKLTNKAGKIVQTGSQTLAINSDSFTNINNALVGSVPLDLGTGNGDDPTNPGSERPDPTEKGPIPGGDGKPGTVETAPPLPPLTLADGAINVKNIVNDNGVLTGNGDIHLTAKESLVNDGSAMHIGNLRLEGSDFTNKNGVLNVVSLSADVDHFVNDAGKLQVQKTIDFNIEELENINKGVIVAGDQISIAAKNVVNEGNSTLASDGAIILRTEALKNYDSEIFAKGLEIKAKDVDNKSGTLTSLEMLSIKANNLDNRQGKIQANQGIALSIQDELDNSAGIIATGENLQLTATTLDNQKGIFNVGNAAIQVAQLYNQEGEIGAHENLEITAHSLDNHQGKVLAESADLKIENIDNRQKGALLASKALQIVGIQLNNETGVMSADDINLTIENINNQQGEMSAEKALVLTGKMLDNRDGLIASNQNLTIHNDSTQNQSGKILAGGDNTLNIQDLNNQQGLIEGHNLSITGNHLDNTSGKIHGNDQVVLTLDKTLNTQNGEITSAKDLTIIASSHQANTPSELKINIDGSELLAGNDLLINGQALVGKGTLAAGQDLTLLLTDDLITSSTIQAGRDLLIDTNGDLTNSGEITSLGGATIHANDIANTEQGSIEANQKVVLTSQNNLENRGLINSNGLTHLEVQGAIYNIATGKIYGDLIAINAKELHNTYEAIDGKKVSGSIAAREQLNIGVDYLLNEEGALLFSGNKLVIGGELDDNFNVVSNAGLVENKSATIESLGDMYLGVDKLVNSNEHFRFEKVEVGERTGLVYIKPFGESERYDVGHFRWEGWEEAGRYRWATSKPITEAGIPGKTLLVEVNGAYCEDLNDPATCTLIPGSDYLPDNPAWAYFKLTPPQAKPMPIDFGLPNELAILPPIKPDLPEGGCEAPSDICQFYDQAMMEYAQDLKMYDEEIAQYTEKLALYGKEYNTYVQAMLTWYDQTNEAYDILNAKILAYNQQLAGKNWGEVRDFTQYNLKETYFEDQIVESDGGKIIAGGNLMLNGGEFINDKSIILVGGDILGDIDRLKNIDQKGHYVTQETGSIFLSTTYKYKKKPSYRNVHRRNHRYAGEHFDEKIEEIDLKAYTVETNTLVQSENAGSVGNVSNIFVTNAGNSGFTDHDLADTNNQNDQYHNDQNLVIANVDVNTDLPSSSIYSINPNSQDYLIETDSKFTNYKNWLGSDYLLNRMGMNGDLILKRLGDGFYEQRLVNDQIAQLTGRRFLEGYANDEAQFKALMENGATFATGLGIAPGVKLSADQVARLTSDIVWLETETVTLADGSRVDVLVPKVYLMIDQNSIHQSGTLIAGDSIELNMRGDLVNQGTIAGRDITSLKANNIENIGGTISGNRVGLTSKENISIAGGSVLADSQLALNAGQDVTIESTTYEMNSRNNSRRGIKREAALYVKNPDGTLSIQAGNDITLKAANIENAGENGKTQLLAGGNINVGTITERESATFVADAKNYDHTARTKDIGSTISAKGDLLIKADDQVNIIGSDLHSNSGTVAISGDKGVNISEGRETLDSSGSRYEKSSGSFSSQSREINFTDKNDTSISSNITGQNVVILTKDDLNIQGSNVVADENVTFVADKNINITASEDHYYHDEEEIIKKSGLMGGGGFGFSVGKKAQETYDENSSLIHNGSMVGSLGGNVNIKAGENYTQEGSHVSAAIGDVNITAESVDIKAAEDSYSSYHREKFKQSGLTVSLGGSIVDAVNQIQSVQESIKDVGKSKNDRVNAMAAVNAAMDLKRLGDSMGAAQDLLSNGMASDQTVAKITATIGSSQSQSETWREDKVASGSAIQAGGNVNITATGGGEDSNIIIEGSYVGGGQSTNLTADNDINILAGENKSTEDSRNSSSGWNAGVVASIGKETGFGVTAGANKGKGKSEGNETYYTNSIVGTDTGKTTIVSGGNTNIIGGEVYGKGVELDVSGDLTIASVQDRSDYHSDQKDASIQGTWMFGGGGSVSGSHSQSKINANHQSVTDQSGIFAGDDGFQVKVEGNTHLSGGVVVANEKAELEGLNSFETGTITSNDLVNQSAYEGEGFGISGGYGYQNDGPNNPKGTNPTQTETVHVPDGSHSINKNVGYGKDKESESSITQSGIGTSNIKVTDNEKQKELTGQTAEEAAKGIESNLTTETADAASGAIENIFDKDKVQAEIDLQVKVTQQFDRTRQEMKQIVNQKIDQYKDSDPDKAKDWQNAGLLLDMLAGGLSSPGDGFLGSLAGAANPAVAQMIKGMVNDGTLEEGGLSHILAHGIAGAAMAAANGGDLLSGALTAGGAEALAPIIAEFLYGKGKTPEDLTADEKNTLSAIIGILGTGAGALTGDSAIDTVIGDSVATNAVENNYLQFVLGSGSSLVEGSFLIGGSSTLLDKEDLGEELAGLLNSILNDLGYGDLDNYANEDGDIDLGTLDSRALEEVKTQTREAYAYAFGKRDQIDNSYFTNNEFGQLLGQTLEIVGVDSQGNPVYSANSKGAGDWINRGDKVVLSDDGQTWDVYTEDGYFLSSLDINGTKSRYITGLKKGSKLVFNPATSEDFGNTLVTIPPKVDNPQEGYIRPEVNIPNHTGDMSGSGKVDTGVIVGGGTNPVDPNDFGGNILESKNPYTPNKDAVGNMSELLKRPGFGSFIKQNSTKTKRVIDGQSIYVADKPFGSLIKKGDQFYLDGLHKDHIEVFDKAGNFKGVLNLDGSENEDKTNKGKGRRIKK